MDPDAPLTKQLYAKLSARISIAPILIYGVSMVRISTTTSQQIEFQIPGYRKLDLM